MTIIFTDSCDVVTTTNDMAQYGKWTAETSSEWSTSESGITPRWPETAYFISFASNAGDLVYKEFSSAEEHATMIVCFAFTSAAAASSELACLLSDLGATKHLTLARTAAGGLEVRRGTLAGTVLASSSAGILASDTAWRYVIFKAYLHDSAGTVEVWYDGTQVISATGLDTKNGGTKSVFDGFTFETAVTSAQGYCDVVVMNGAGSVNNDIPTTKDLRVECIRPSGNGTTSQGVGSDGNSTDNYALVDDQNPSVSDYVGVATDDEKDTYAYENLASATGTVLGVVGLALASKSDVGAKSIAFVARESGGTEADGADSTLSTSWLYAKTVMETDPDAAAWTVSSVNAAEFGFKARP